ncbi:MAG: alpha-ketoacid dehydrogenase subunit beta [Deltaproteobacteria bacterium]|nr:alpha-ketoacid dehydrogenase subunit beta [Deltaproteobacteria bacterium]
MRELKYSQAILEATDLCMEKDPTVYLMGLGVPDPKGVFGTTAGLQKKYGEKRVFDMPTSENGMTGIAIGSALTGMKPLMVHQRIDFALLAMEQIVNQAAKWNYMFGGQQSIPLVIRLIIGQGWGQGPQHSQSLQAWFAHIPGLKVVMPTTAYDAKGMLIAAIEDPNPVIFLEHRWLHNTTGDVPEGHYTVPLGKSKVVRVGSDLTVVATSNMVLEAIKAAEILKEVGVQTEIIDVRSLRPLDEEPILNSVRKTGHLIVADNAWKSCGFASEVVALAAEKAFSSLKRPPERVTQPDVPSPATPALANDFFPRGKDIVEAAEKVLGLTIDNNLKFSRDPKLLDIPDKNFTGPF